MDHPTEVSPEQEAIKQQMETTRTALQEKLETLEQQVKNTVEEATSAVTDTVQTVKEVVEDTVSTVKGSVEDTVETVKSTFDVRLQVERHPWAMFAGATAVGFVGGRLLSRLMPQPPAYEHNGHGLLGGLFGGTAPVAATMAEASDPNPPAPPPSSYAPREEPRYEALPSHEDITPAPAPRKPGLLHTIAEHYSDELSTLKGLAIATVAGLIREMLVKQVPQALTEQVTDIVDGVTRKMGAQPIRGPILQTQGQEGHG